MVCSNKKITHTWHNIKTPGLGIQSSSFTIKLIVFSDQKIDRSWKRSNRLIKLIRSCSIFLKDWWDRFDLFKRSTKAIRSWSMCFKDRKYQKIERSHYLSCQLALWSGLWIRSSDFFIESIIFSDWKINLIVQKIESLLSIFFKIARVNSLTIDLF